MDKKGGSKGTVLAGGKGPKGREYNVALPVHPNAWGPSPITRCALSGVGIRFEVEFNTSTRAIKSDMYPVLLKDCVGKEMTLSSTGIVNQYNIDVVGVVCFENNAYFIEERDARRRRLTEDSDGQENAAENPS